MGCISIGIGTVVYLYQAPGCPCSCLEEYIIERGTLAEGICKKDPCVFEYTECLYNNTYSICNSGSISWKDAPCGDIEKEAKSTSLAAIIVFTTVGFFIFAIGGGVTYMSKQMDKNESK